MNLTLKTKEELISELNSDGNYYKNVFGNPSFSDKNSVYKAFMEDGDPEYVKKINFDSLALIWFDCNDKIVAATFLTENFIDQCNGTFYDIFLYQVKSSRRQGFGNIIRSSVTRTLYGLTYYESHEYVVKNNLNIDGILWIMYNRSFLKWIKNKKIFNDDGYHLAFYLTHFITSNGFNTPAYVLYYPTSEVNLLTNIL